ncbi:hypothetical protein D6C98_02226 [Aureobasidium pullulans]|nr:hypothetical protein D6C98_02226 [Aureobasidium pullulans]THZ99540.1 hypothetical protein D6C82_05089 [Aureobasidium pullulans]
MTNTPPNPTDLSLPRILCLHGGGVTAEIFQLQARSLIKALPTFRLIFADGPFYCPPGPGIVPVYEDYGPFRRWLRWLPEHADIDDEAAIEEVMDLMRKYCHPDAVTLVEWDGTHRVPLKKTDVDKICTEIYRVAKEQGVRC